MSKHIKMSHRHQPESRKQENWKRRQRRKRLKAKVAARRDYMAGWVDRPDQQVSA